MKRSMHALAWVLLAVVAVLLWPKDLGGSMTYVITSGTSMKPTFSAGDLAVLRTADDYRVGDVVAFRSEELGRVVMHRVLTEQDGTYTFQGDNNDFVDPDRVTEQQVLGRLVLRVPQVGPVLEWLFTPVNLLLVVGGLYLVVGDRREEQAAVVPSPESLVLQVPGFDIPAGAAVADVLDPQDLQRLAQRYNRPVLYDERSGQSWVDDGTTVYRYRVPIEAAPEAGTGREQDGVGADVLALLPRPRRQSPPVEPDVDLGRLPELS